MKRVVCTFANHFLAKGFPRFKEQAESMNVFDEIIFYTHKDVDKSIKRRYQQYYFPYSRGYGYWTWKPYIILKTLEQLNEGDILLYTDVGCFFNPKGRERLLDYFEIVDKSPASVLGFQSYEENYNGMPETVYYEYEWTKGDIFDYFGVRDDKSYTHTTQIESTAIFFKKNEKAMSFVKDWHKALWDDIALITDEPSRSPNLPGFKENRHDQSLYSILGKKYGITTLSTNEIFPENQNWKLLEHYPIWAMRDKHYPSKSHYKHRFRIRKIYSTLCKIKCFFRGK